MSDRSAWTVSNVDYVKSLYAIIARAMTAEVMYHLY
jgi:hypothetical protein